MRSVTEKTSRNWVSIVTVVSERYIGTKCGWVLLQYINPEKDGVGTGSFVAK